MSRGKLSGEGRPKRELITPPWIRVTRHPQKQWRIHPLIGQVVRVKERDHGSFDPALFVEHEAADGTITEYQVFDDEWELP